jgi:hypothetical protein
MKTGINWTTGSTIMPKDGLSGSSKMLVSISPITQHHITEKKNNLDAYCQKNLTYYIL